MTNSPRAAASSQEGSTPHQTGQAPDQAQDQGRPRSRRSRRRRRRAHNALASRRQNQQSQQNKQGQEGKQGQQSQQAPQQNKVQSAKTQENKTQRRGQASPARQPQRAQQAEQSQQAQQAQQPQQRNQKSQAKPQRQRPRRPQPPQQPEQLDPQREAELAAAPYAALSVQSTGIHPSTSRLVSIDVLTFDAEGNTVEEFHQVLNPGCDVGPFHLHGLTPEDVAQGKRFSQILKQLGQLLDGRTVIVHNSPRVWGFVVSESRRAMSNAARANRSRGNRRRGRRQRVGRVPQPKLIVDTLATARRQDLAFDDTRIRALAASYGIEAPPAAASVARASVPEAETSRQDTELIRALYLTQRGRGPLAEITPSDLRGDRFHLQRSAVRVEAMDAAKPYRNPGVYTPGRGLVQGMEVVVAPEIAMDPDIIIEAVLREGLAYSEKLTRQTSVVVCNKKTDLLGKAMHGHRKGIPLLSDQEFLKAAENVVAGERAYTT